MYDWELPDPVLVAWVRLRQAWEAIYKVMEVELDKRETTLAQIDVLTILSLSKAPLTPGQIASYMFREKHSASALLSRMQRAGYVKKVRSRKDQRVVKIRMQPKGEELLKQALRSGLGQTHKVLRSCLTEGETKQLDGLLKKVRDCSLKELGMRTEPFPLTTGVPGLLSVVGAT